MKFFPPYPCTIRSAQIRKTRLSVQLCNYKHVGVCNFLKGNPFPETPHGAQLQRLIPTSWTSPEIKGQSHTSKNRSGWSKKKKKVQVSPIKKVINDCCRLRQQVSGINAGFLITNFQTLLNLLQEKIGGRVLSKVFTPSSKSEKRERETKELQKFTVILTNVLWCETYRTAHRHREGQMFPTRTYGNKSMLLLFFF